MKANCPIFQFLNLDRGILNLIYLKVEKGPNLHCFCKFFFLNSPIWLWNHVPDLSIHNAVWFHLADIKIDSQHAVKKVLDIAEDWYNPELRVIFHFSLVIGYKQKTWQQPASIHYSIVLFTVYMHRFSFSRYLDLAECQFSSDIFLRFPDLGILCIHFQILFFGKLMLQVTMNNVVAYFLCLK